MTTSTPIPEVPSLAKFDKDLPKLQRDLADAVKEDAAIRAKLAADTNQTISVRQDLGPKLRRTTDRREQLAGEVRARRQAASDQAAQAVLAGTGFRQVMREFLESEAFQLEEGARLILFFHKAAIEGVVLPHAIVNVPPTLRARLLEFKALMAANGRFIDQSKIPADVVAACAVIW